MLALWPSQNDSVLQTLDSHAATLILLSLLSLLLVVLGLNRNARPGNSPLLRHGLLVTAGGLCLLTALLSVPWLSFVALLLLIYCLLLHLSQASWVSALTWLLPAATLPLLPSQPAWDLAIILKSCCLQSISLILEAAQIPNMLEEDQIQFENGFLSADILIRRFTDPYKLLGMGAFVLVLCRQKLIVGTSVVSLIAPFCWFVSTLYGAIGIVFYVQDICNLFKPARIAIFMNFVCCVLICGLLLLSQRAIIGFWSPFEHVPPRSIYSIFNAIVEFPDLTEEKSNAINLTPKSRKYHVSCGLAAVCFLVAAVIQGLS